MSAELEAIAAELKAQGVRCRVVTAAVASSSKLVTELSKFTKPAKGLWLGYATIAGDKVEAIISKDGDVFTVELHDENDGSRGFVGVRGGKLEISETPTKQFHTFDSLEAAHGALCRFAEKNK